MKVFLSGTSFNASYGGPAVSVASHAVGLAKAGASVAVWAPDGSAVANMALAGQPGLTPLGGSLRSAWQAAGPCDLIHDNGIWMPHNHALAEVARRANVPRVVSVRGMLERWAFNYRRTKKRIAWHLYQRRDLIRADRLHATSDSEATNIVPYRLGVPVSVIPNGIDIDPNPLPRRIEDGAERSALCLGRVHPIKALPLMLEAWAQELPAGWRFRIVGPDETGHTAELNALVRSLALDRVVSFEPPVARADTRALWSTTDLLVLCSHSENFGMSVAEALMHRVPVLTSRGTPWRSVADAGCGWSVETSVAGLAAGLRQATMTSPAELDEMGRRGRRLVEERFSSASVASQFLALYEGLAAERSRAA